MRISSRAATEGELEDLRRLAWNERDRSLVGPGFLTGFVLPNLTLFSLIMAVGFFTSNIFHISHSVGVAWGTGWAVMLVGGFIVWQLRSGMLAKPDWWFMERDLAGGRVECLDVRVKWVVPVVPTLEAERDVCGMAVLAEDVSGQIVFVGRRRVPRDLPTEYWRVERWPRSRRLVAESGNGTAAPATGPVLAADVFTACKKLNRLWLRLDSCLVLSRLEGSVVRSAVHRFEFCGDCSNEQK